MNFILFLPSKKKKFFYQKDYFIYFVFFPFCFAPGEMMMVRVTGGHVVLVRRVPLLLSSKFLIFLDFEWTDHADSRPL